MKRRQSVLEDSSKDGSRLCSTNRALAQAAADDTIAGCALPKALYSDALVALWYLYLYIVSSAAVALLHRSPCASFKTQPGTAALQLKPNASTPSPRAAASEIDAIRAG